MLHDFRKKILSLSIFLSTCKRLFSSLFRLCERHNYRNKSTIYINHNWTYKFYWLALIVNNYYTFNFKLTQKLLKSTCCSNCGQIVYNPNQFYFLMEIPTQMQHVTDFINWLWHKYRSTAICVNCISILRKYQIIITNGLHVEFWFGKLHVWIVWIFSYVYKLYFSIWIS